MIKKLCFLLTSWALSLQSATPFVSCHLDGQLGNQLFQIATTLAYAWDYQATPIFPELNLDQFRRPYNRDRIFSRLNCGPLPRPYSYQYNEPIWHSPNRIAFHPDLYLVGYFLSWRHFHHHREKLLALFAPSPIYLGLIERKYQYLLDHPKTVAVHVRTFDKSRHELGKHPFIGLDYYKKAMDLFPEDSLFVFFSDRINWCKKQFSSLSKNMVFVEGNDHILDLFLMARMKHLILSNSTYSWWGGLSQ